MHEPQIDDDEFLFEPHRSFVVDLCRAIGLNTCGLVSFRLSAGEDDTHIPRIRAEYVLGHEFGQPAQKVLHEYSLVATPISSQEVGTVDRSVSLSTLFETIHRVVDSPTTTCSQEGCTSATSSISLQVDPVEIAEIDALLLALEHAPERVRDELFGRVHGLLASLPDCDLTIAPVAGNDVFRLELPAGWKAELRAVAARACQADSLCAHGDPHAK